jgi:sortase A
MFIEDRLGKLFIFLSNRLMNYRKHKIVAIVFLAIIFLGINYFEYISKQIKYVFQKSNLTSDRTLNDGPSGAVEKDKPSTIWIESIGVEAPLTYPQKESEEEFQKFLQDGVAHYPNTALPGQPGNVFLFGHSSDLIFAKGNYKTVFALLPKVKEGEIIKVSDPQGNLFSYKISGTKVVSPKDIQYLDQDYEKKSLTLQTSYPVGTALKRFLVFAELVE